MKYLIIALIISALFSCSVALAAGMPLSFSGQNYQVRVKSLKELKEENCILQTDEFTCGAAALATILRDLGDETVSEKVLLQQEKELEKGQGISVLELQKLAAKRGFKAVGYKMDLLNLFSFKRPMLMHVATGPNKEGHYYVFRGIYKDRIYLKDPAQGNIRMSLEEFAKIWTGIVLAIEEKNDKLLTNIFDPPDLAQPELIAVGVNH